MSVVTSVLYKEWLECIRQVVFIVLSLQRCKPRLENVQHTQHIYLWPLVIKEDICIIQP